MYAVNKLLSAEEEEGSFKNGKEADTRGEFCHSIRLKIVRKKGAFLLHQLLADFKANCEENDVEPFIEHTVVLKRELKKQFEDRARGRVVKTSDL